MIQNILRVFMHVLYIYLKAVRRHDVSALVRVGQRLKAPLLSWRAMIEVI